MKKPISPQEWDASPPRAGRFSVKRPTDAEYREQLLHYVKHEAARIGERSVVQPMLEIGGREWRGNTGKHRVYFTSNSMKGNELGKYVNGYYDVAAREFVSVSQTMSNDELESFITEAIERGGVEPPTPRDTFDAAGRFIEKGSLCILLSDRVVSRPTWDISNLVGAPVRAHCRYATDKFSLYPTAWFITPESSDSFTVTSKNFAVERQTLLVDSASMLVIDDFNERDPQSDPLVCRGMETA